MALRRSAKTVIAKKPFGGRSCAVSRLRCAVSRFVGDPKTNQLAKHDDTNETNQANEKEQDKLQTTPTTGNKSKRRAKDGVTFVLSLLP